MWIFQNH